jgi:hypothetical protein
MGRVQAFHQSLPTPKLCGLHASHLLCPYDRILVRVAGELSGVLELADGTSDAGAIFCHSVCLFYLVGLAVL